jgi:hypothetical protein
VKPQYTIIWYFLNRENFTENFTENSQKFTENRGKKRVTLSPEIMLRITSGGRQDSNQQKSEVEGFTAPNQTGYLLLPAGMELWGYRL